MILFLKPMTKLFAVALIVRVVGVELGLNTISKCTHVFEKLLFSILPSILFCVLIYLIFGLFFTFWALMGYFGVGVGIKNSFKVYWCIWKTFILYVFFISNFWFDFVLGYFFAFGGTNGLFLGPSLLFGALMVYFWGRFRIDKLFCGLLMYLNNFYFLWFLQF